MCFGELHVMADLRADLVRRRSRHARDILVGDPEGVIAIPQAVDAEVAAAGVEASVGTPSHVRRWRPPPRRGVPVERASGRVRGDESQVAGLT